MKKFLSVAILGLLIANTQAAEVHFSNIDRFIISQIESAKSSVNVCVFIYEWQPIADALIQAQKRGVKVELLTDFRSVNLQNKGGEWQGTTIQYTAKNGVDTYVWNRVEQKAIMHNKFVIIDDAILLLGSYNFQEGATFRNHENFCLIRDENIIEAYKEQYIRIKSESEKYLPNEVVQTHTRLISSDSIYQRYSKLIKKVALIASLLLNLILIFLLILKKK